MTPPQLTRDTPVLNVVHPRHVHVAVLLRHELDVDHLAPLQLQAAASGAIFTYHWSVNNGSTITPERSPRGGFKVYGWI